MVARGRGRGGGRRAAPRQAGDAAWLARGPDAPPAAPKGAPPGSAVCGLLQRLAAERTCLRLRRRGAPDQAACEPGRDRQHPTPASGGAARRRRAVVAADPVAMVDHLRPACRPIYMARFDELAAEAVPRNALSQIDSSFEFAGRGCASGPCLIATFTAPGGRWTWI